MIHTKNLVFKGFLSYPELEIKEHQTSFIIGESGVGKSAFLRMINGSESSPDNSLFIQGTDINELDPIEVRKDYLLCGQSVFLFPGTISDNFAMFYSLRNIPTPSDEIIQKFLDLVCLPIAADSKIDTMSGGEKQRVYLAIFISLARHCILLDEPTSALDKATAERLLTNLKAYCQEASLSAIIISHDDSLATEFADAILDLNKIERGNF